MDGMNGSIHAHAALAVSSDQMQSLARALSAARYAFHKVTVHRYAVTTFNGAMNVEQAKEAYLKAMANYDQIIASAMAGASQDHNQAEMAKGSTAIDEALKAAGHG